MSFFFYCYGHHRDLHSFPTRRSSDLFAAANRRAWLGHGIALLVCAALFAMLLSVPPQMLPEQLADAVRLQRSEEHTSELQSQFHLVCRLLLEKKKKKLWHTITDHNSN